MRFYFKKKAEHAAVNLTTRGTPRIYELHDLCDGHEQAHGNKRHALRERLYTARKNADGLTRRGNKKPARGRPLYQSWQALRSNITVGPVSFEDVHTSIKAYA